MAFVGEVIEVQTEGEPKRPKRSAWRGRSYRVEHILASWHDASMPDQLRRPRWTMRRHRNYYHVQTDGGERFEIYLDRGAKRPEWVLLRSLGRAPDSSSESD